MKNDARTISRDALHERRRTAVMLFRGGLGRAAVAKRLGVHRNTVGEWIAAWKDGGLRRLKPRPGGRPAGSGMTLDDKQSRTIRNLIIDKCPDQLKLSFALWTREAVQQLIKQKLGIDMPIRTVGLYLKRWGFTPQKPLTRAFERDDSAVRRWLKTKYPAIKKRAKAENACIHWGDETGVRSDDQTGRGYAPKGRTPVRLRPGTPQKVNMMSTITNQGLVRFMFYKGSMNAARLIEFMRRLIKDAKQKVILILDNLRTHHARKVKAWTEARRDKIELFYLPSYSPHLNPDEYLNCDLKAGIARQPSRREPDALHATAMSHMRMLQKRPERVKRYFEHRDIRYAR